MFKRLSALLVLDSGLVVNSYNFKTHLPVGKLKFTLHRLQELEIDEIVILNTTHTLNPVRDFKEILAEINSCHIATPLAYGGGITRVQDAVEIIKLGAERIVVTSKLLNNSNEFFEMCSYLGDQAIILHLPIEFETNKIKVRSKENVDLPEVIVKLPKNWGGEIMLSMVANDGAKNPNWNNVTKALNASSSFTNFILAGGFSNSEDISKGFEMEQVTAIAVGNFLHRVELSVVNIKSGIGEGIKIRRTI